MKEIEEKVVNNKMEIEEYIQNKECQNQIFHLANYFGIPIKDMILILNNNNIKLSHYKINSYKFSNKNLNNTFKEFEQIDNMNIDKNYIYDFVIHNSFRKAEKEFKSDRLNLKFWLDINGYDIFSLTNSNKVNKEISKTLEINVNDFVDNKRLNQIKEEIKKGTNWFLLKEKFPELNEHKRTWKRWFEKENLKVNKDNKERMEIIKKRKTNEFEIKYNDFILEKINEGFNNKDIRKMIINDFGEPSNYCPINIVIQKNFSKEYKDNLEKRKLRYPNPNPKTKKNNQNCSSSEQKTKEFLERNKINFIQEKTFNDLKFINCLRYDFYLPDFNLLIELDGEQHFKWVPHFDKNIEKFEERKIKDEMKNQYAKENNINLLRIPYYQFDDIELIICNYFIDNYNLKEKNLEKVFLKEKEKYQKLKEEREQFCCPYCNKKMKKKGYLTHHINKKHKKNNK